MQIQLSKLEIILSVLALLGMIAFIVAIIVIYKLISLYKKSLVQSQNNTTRFQHADFEPNVVVIGGGTGQSISLRGLKHVTKNITAVVTVADDGGGSGALREDLGMLPPGDIRNCLLALANIEPTMNEVMQYRFPEGALKGQSFGNLFIAAMTGLYDNFETAVYKMSQIFAITGRVLPVTMDDINLVAELENGDVVIGESHIPKVSKKMNSPIKRLYLDKNDARPLDEVIQSIKNADAIVIGPGSLYTSILPNLLVDGIIDALSASKAPKIYVCNIMTQPGETDGKNVLEHVNVLVEHAGINFIDYVISNNEELPVGVFERYAKDGAKLVLLDDEQKHTLNMMGITYLEQKLIEIKNGYIRHDSELVANAVMKIAIKHNYKNNI
ncbi:gluconeogenesis factor YvcK family protein [Peptostreptococcus canis]|uniref:Putative gluconeogenesis factor n=1 Tax=Peptostreptococcus canis TaxID=1159213 RepID=A0ABR6TJ87_9FIRM|nr:gluconeogenesis factor YvcK family protein [Peptostreptococcus canis]MBC2575490.1 YvcK family protein [Peptostreptococcus canis]MBP1997318.1 putative cofD-like protein [Peptostreptococcus canis]